MSLFTILIAVKLPAYFTRVNDHDHLTSRFVYQRVITSIIIDHDGSWPQSIIKIIDDHHS